MYKTVKRKIISQVKFGNNIPKIKPKMSCKRNTVRCLKSLTTQHGRNRVAAKADSEKTGWKISEWSCSTISCTMHRGEKTRHSDKTWYTQVCSAHRTGWKTASETERATTHVEAKTRHQKKWTPDNHRFLKTSVSQIAELRKTWKSDRMIKL